MTFNRNQYRSILYPVEYIPPKDCTARHQWDKQEATIDLIDPAILEVYHKKMLVESIGFSGDAYLVA